MRVSVLSVVLFAAIQSRTGEALKVSWCCNEKSFSALFFYPLPENPVPFPSVKSGRLVDLCPIAVKLLSPNKSSRRVAKTVRLSQVHC